MVSGPGLQQQLDQKIRDIKQVVSGVDEQKALERPAEGEWCIKEVLSHLAGQDTANVMHRLKRILDEDTPNLDITPGVSAYDAQREQASVSKLLSTVETQYTKLGKLLNSLTEDQLARKAHVPALQGSPLGEYPTLGQWAGFVVNFHIAGHVNQLRNLCQQ
jgi:hypothetical protein